MQAPTVVVLWTGYRPGPWALRSLRAAGYSVIGVHPEGRGGGRSVACLHPRRCPSPASAPEATLEALERLFAREHVAAVLPLDEDCTSLLASAAPSLGPAVVVGPNSRQYRLLCDKDELARTAREAGVGAPEGVTVTGAGASGAWPPLPSVVKARRSANCPGRLDGVVVAATPAQRDTAVRRLVEAGVDARVEECVHAAHLSVHAMRWAGGAMDARAFRIVRTQPREAGMPSLFTEEPDGAGAIDAARRLLDAAGYVGAANVQLFERDGHLLVHDVNLRPPATIALSMRAGLDLPRLAVDAALGRPRAAGPARARRPVRYLSLVDELKALAGARGARAGASSGRLGILRDLAHGALSRVTVLDPPPRDLLWMLLEADAAVHRAVGRRRGTARRASQPPSIS